MMSMVLGSCRYFLLAASEWTSLAGCIFLGSKTGRISLEWLTIRTESSDSVRTRLKEVIIRLGKAAKRKKRGG